MWLFREMRKDLAGRAPHYSSDWTDGLSAKVLSASLFMFCTSIAPAITFAGDMVQNTNENGVAQIGPPEVLLSTGAHGHHLFDFSRASRSASLSHWPRRRLYESVV